MAVLLFCTWNVPVELLTVLAVPAVAIGVSGSVWAGVIIAAIELGCCGLLRSRRQPQ
jgi:hypothetical protein